MTVLQFMLSNFSEVLRLTLEHVGLVAVSTIIAIVIGVPLGIVMTRRPALSKPVITFANVIQTVPSLALFGFLIPIPVVGGIGARTAIVALLLWGLANPTVWLGMGLLGVFFGLYAVALSWADLSVCSRPRLWDMSSTWRVARMSCTKP